MSAEFPERSIFGFIRPEVESDILPSRGAPNCKITEQTHFARLDVAFHWMIVRENSRPTEKQNLVPHCSCR